MACCAAVTTALEVEERMARSTSSPSKFRSEILNGFADIRELSGSSNVLEKGFV
jgi:hypothetical protein